MQFFAIFFDPPRRNSHVKFRWNYKTEDIGQKINALQSPQEAAEQTGQVADSSKNEPRPKQESTSDVTDTKVVGDESIEVDAGKVSQDFSHIKPVGKGFFGNIYDQFKSNAKEAVAFLMQKKEGEAIGALNHKDVGDIDLVWGNDKAGLKKIAVTKEDFTLVPDIIDNYDTIERGGKNNTGRDTIIYTKTYADGTTYMVEEMRTGREELSLNTMYKRKTGSDSLQKPSVLTPETTPGSSLTNIQNNQHTNNPHPTNPKQCIWHKSRTN